MPPCCPGPCRPSTGSERPGHPRQDPGSGPLARHVHGYSDGPAGKGLCLPTDGGEHQEGPRHGAGCGEGRHRRVLRRRSPVLRILELQAPGSRRMAATDYLRGHPITSTDEREQEREEEPLWMHGEAAMLALNACQRQGDVRRSAEKTACGGGAVWTGRGTGHPAVLWRAAKPDAAGLLSFRNSPTSP